MELQLKEIKHVSTVLKKSVEENQISGKIQQLEQKLPELGKLFDVHRQIGEGSFSSVYLASLKGHRELPPQNRRWFAIKHLIPTSHPDRVEQELRCLREIGGKEHVIGVDLCLRHLDNVVLVMPYIQHKRFSEYMSEMDAEELRLYVRALLVALRRVHAAGLIHRDVKPANFLYDRDNRRYQLVDFGLSQKVVLAPRQNKRTRDQMGEVVEGASAPPRKRAALELRAPSASTQAPQHVCVCWGRAAVCGACGARGGARAARAGTPGYRAPEVLLRAPRQTAAIDMWACGALMAAVLLRRPTLLRAASDLSALAELNVLLGSARLQQAAREVGRRVVWSSPRRGLCLRRAAQHASRPTARAPACAHCGRAPCICLTDTPAGEISSGRWWAGFPDEAFALCARLLEPRPSARITAARALHHPFITGSYTPGTPDTPGTHTLTQHH